MIFKNIFKLSIIFSIFFIFSLNAFCSENNPGPKILFNNQEFGNMFVSENNVLISVKDFATASGKTIEWDGNERSISLDKTIKFYENTQKYLYNGETRVSDYPAIIENNTFYVPFNTLVELFDYKVEYNPVSMVININTSGEFKQGICKIEYSLGIDINSYLNGRTPNTIIVDRVTMSATAYTNHEGPIGGNGITSIGRHTVEGRTIAVDPKVIPYNTMLRINGREGYVAEDCGGAIKGNKIDIFMESNKEMYAWGRRNVLVEILETLEPAE